MKLLQRLVSFALLALMFLGTLVIAPIYVSSRILTKDNIKKLLHKLPADEKVEELLIGTAVTLHGTETQISKTVITKAIQTADLDSVTDQLVDKTWEYIETGEETSLMVDPVPGENINIPIEILKINEENRIFEKIRTTYKVINYSEIVFFTYVGVLAFLVFLIFPGNKLFSLVLSAIFASLGTMVSYGVLWGIRKSANSIVNNIVSRSSNSLNNILKTDTISFDPITSLTEIGTDLLQRFLDLVNPEYVRIVGILCGSVFVFLFLMLISWLLKKGFGAIKTEGKVKGNVEDEETDESINETEGEEPSKKDTWIEKDKFIEPIEGTQNVVKYQDQKDERKIKRSGEIRFDK